MKTKAVVIMLMLVVGVALGSKLWAADQVLKKARHHSQWEHLSLTHELRDGQSDQEVSRTIQKLGREGWELVSVSNFNESGTTIKTAYYFKRQLGVTFC